MVVIRPPEGVDAHVCSPEPGVVIRPYRSKLACYKSGTYLVDYPAGTTLICDVCEKVYTAEGWSDWANHAAFVHRETASERKLRESRT